MRIGIDCRLWETTTGRHIRENVKHLAKIDSENEYVLFFLGGDIDKFDAPDNFKKVEVNIHWHTFEEQLRMPKIFLKENLDLLHIPYYNVPIFYPKKFAVTIHDLTIMKVNTGRASTRSKLFYKIKKLGFKIAIWFAVYKSDKIFTVSEFVKEDIIKNFKVDPEKIVVTYNGVDNKFRPIPKPLVTEIIKKYDINKPYIFYVGNAHPHKNIESLVEAFGEISKKEPNLSLVIGGKRDYFIERLITEYGNKDYFEKINFTGFIDDNELPAIYSGAEVFVFPSLSEGFGLMLLEAFSCGTKVACSNATSLPEIGGDAAYYFDPKDLDDMVVTISKAINDPTDKKIQWGYDRIKEFNWEDSAQKILNTYKSLWK